MIHGGSNLYGRQFISNTRIGTGQRKSEKSGKTGTFLFTNLLEP